MQLYYYALFQEFIIYQTIKTVTNKNKYMNDVKIPSIGRMVHYFPNGSERGKHAAANNATCLPATVVQVFGTRINLAVTCMNNDAPVILRYSVQHKSMIGKKPGTDELAEQDYWDWPEIK